MPFTRSPSPPEITHNHQIIPIIPTTSLIESVARAAHYSGARVDSPEAHTHHRRRSSTVNENHRTLRDEHAPVLKDIIELFECRPSAEIFERSWNKDAVFEDPLSYCKGYAEYAPQWFALPKLFSQSKSISTRVMSSTHSPNQLVYHQIQEYTVRFFHLKKTIESVVVVHMDENYKIVHLADQWNGQVPGQWFGASLFRKFNAKLTPWLVRVPKYSS